MANEVDVRTLGEETMRLNAAIMLYGNGVNRYATFHTVRRGKGGAQLDAGRPATVEGCAEFARMIADRGAFGGFVVPRMIYISPRVVAWWRAPAPARVWFQCEKHKEADKDIGTRSAIVPHPGLVFTLARGLWYVHALRTDARPEPSTQLYTAPYFNVDTNGLICEGNLKRPERVTPETLDTFEKAFFESRFTHPNIRRASHFARFKGGPYAFWQYLLGGGVRQAPAPAFPLGALVRSPAGTLQNHIKKLEARQHGD